MSDEDLQKFLDSARTMRLEYQDAPEKARELLVEEGFITPDGELAEAYR